MPQPKLTIEEKLIKYNISNERYHDESSRLVAAGFTQAQADKLIVRVSSKKTVESVLNNYNTLSNAPYGFSHEQIVAMASNNGGAQAMKTVLASFTSLQAVGFSTEQIVAMASNGGGAQAIKTVLESFVSLQAVGFSNEKIVAMASNNGGAQAMKTVLESFVSLQAVGFSTEQIVAIASNNGGAQAIKTVLKYHTELSHYDYSLEHITSLAARIGGATRITRASDNEFEAFVKHTLLELLPDETLHDVDPTSNDLDLGSRFYVDYDKEPQPDRLEAIEQSQANDVGVNIPENPIPPTQNNTPLQTLGLFATTSSGCKRKQCEDHSIENHQEPLKKTTKHQPKVLIFNRLQYRAIEH